MTDKNEPADAMQGNDQYDPSNGLTARERAAIDLRVPESGTDWLDDMIRKANRREAAMVGAPNPAYEADEKVWHSFFELSATVHEALEKYDEYMSKRDVDFADALLSELEKGGER